MHAIVKSGQRMLQQVLRKTTTNVSGVTRSQNADTIAAKKMPVPVAESQLNS